MHKYCAQDVYNPGKTWVQTTAVIDSTKSRLMTLCEKSVIFRTFYTAFTTTLPQSIRSVYDLLNSCLYTPSTRFTKTTTI
jgi:hypothetical protein